MYCVDCIYHHVRMSAEPCCNCAVVWRQKDHIHFQPKSSKVVEIEAEAVRTRLVEHVDKAGFVRTSIVKSARFDPEEAWKATKLASGDIT
jgi:hypothetical protein